MKKTIVIISIALLAFAVALAGNSWAARENGGHSPMDRGVRFVDVDDPVRNHDNRGRFRGRGRDHFPRRYFVRPGPRFKHKYFKRHHYRPAHRFRHKYYRWHRYRAPHRFHPKFRHWRRHRPVYRHRHPAPFRWQHSHSVVQKINNYYSSAEDYASPAEAFQASAWVPDSGFSIPIGASSHLTT